MPPPDKQGQQQASPAFARFVLGTVEGIAYSVETIIRANIGARRSRDMGAPLFFAISLSLLLILFSLPSSSPADSQGLFLFFVFCCASVAAHCKHRITAWRRRGNPGEPEHTRYNGFPGLLRPLHLLFPRLSEDACKCWGEPIALLLAGIALLAASPWLGCYLLMAAGGIAWTDGRRHYLERELVMDTTDGTIDMLCHTAAVAHQYSTAQDRPAPHVIDAAPAPRNRSQEPHAGEAGPAEAGHPPSPGGFEAASPPPPPPQPAPDLPAGFYAGLNDNLLHLLQEPYDQ